MHVVLEHDSSADPVIPVRDLPSISNSRAMEDLQELIHQITRLIKRETNLGVQEMNVYLEDGKMILSGYCRTFYTKQLAQEAALKIVGNVELVNNIRVA